MRKSALMIFMVSGLALPACGEVEPNHGVQDGVPEPASTIDPSAAAVLAQFGEPYVGANLNNGARIWRSCQSCHTLPDGARHMVGPNLYALFDREAGGADDFRYSDALIDADFIWTPDLLDQWLANPRDFLPGNRMSFAGLRQETDRRDLIAYLAVETSAEAIPPAP